MIFKQYYLGCLAHASYLIASNGEAAIVDPQRDIAGYLDDLAAQNLKLRYILETHIHADFVSGHLELARATGATIVFGARAQNVQFAFHPMRDGDEIRVGDVVIRALETPGHTPESTCYLVSEPTNADEPERLLSGDILFIGEVGRPDLAGSRGFTATQMAEALYDSLRHKIMPLPRETLVFPAHGAGSLCGKKICASKTWSTLAEQLQTNYALQPMPRDEFVKLATDNLPEVPEYFPRSVDLNRQAIPELKDLARPAALGAEQFAAQMSQPGAVVLDARENYLYGCGHVPGSLSIPLSGTFAVWAGSFIAPASRVLLVVNDEAEALQAQLRMARVGLHNVTGYLDGGIEAWEAAGRPLALLEHVDVDEAAPMVAAGVRIIDVRRPGEFESGHIAGSLNLPLDQLATLAAPLDRSIETLLVCRSGQRSVTGGSILEQLGFTNLHNLVGGYTAWSLQHAGGEPATV